MKDIEHQHQVALMKWCKLQESVYPELALIYAVPNGGQRHIAVAAKLKAEGVRAGVPDICLPVARGGYHALYVELKAPKGRCSPAQIEWQGKLSAAGNHAVTCWGWESARDAIVRYLNLRDCGA